MTHPFQRGTYWIPAELHQFYRPFLVPFLVLRSYVPECHRQRGAELWNMDVMFNDGRVLRSLAVPTWKSGTWMRVF